MKTPLNGKITISRYTGGEKGSGITISLVDELSGTEFCEVDITAEVLANALTGLARLPCEFELRPGHVGKKREIKSEAITFDGALRKDAKDLAKSAVAPFETDGWVGSYGDLLNHHNRGKDNTYRVSFRRYVNP